MWSEPASFPPGSEALNGLNYTLDCEEPDYYSGKRRTHPTLPGAPFAIIDY